MVDERFKEQFRILAEIFTDIELATVQRFRMLGSGMSVRDVDTYLQSRGVSVQGAGVIISFIRQSDTIQYSEDETYLVPKPKGKKVADGMMELLYDSVQGVEVPRKRK